MSHKNSLFSSSTNHPFFSLQTIPVSISNKTVTRSWKEGRVGTDLPSLYDFIISSDGKVLLSANFDSTSKQGIIMIETLDNGSDFRLTQLQISNMTPKGGDFEAFGYSPCAVSGFGVNGSFIDCAGSHEGGINVRCPNVSTIRKD
jgi:hypothetical protein